MDGLPRQDSRLHFKIADAPGEFEQIHTLNYQTFVEEIPQHSSNLQKSLRDRFHDENCYLIALHQSQLSAMVAVRSQRPFSLDAKLDDLDTYLPPHHSLCEIRLLAVIPHFRNTLVLPGLIGFLADYCIGNGFDLAVISGTVHQLRLYNRLGFQPFGPRVGTPQAQYQPMFLSMSRWRGCAARFSCFQS